MRNKKLSRRRAATVLAAFSALIMSSGIALMVSASPAQAAKNPVNVCHATSSDSNPYVFITVDDDSIWDTNKHVWRGHGKHRDDPNKHWKSAGTYEGQPHAAGDLKPDLIQSFTDDDGVVHPMDGNITSASCDDVVTEFPPAVVDVDFTDPDCDNDNQASWDYTGSHLKSVEITDGSVGPGQSVEITATAEDGYLFEPVDDEDGSSTKVFTHTFGPTEICDIVLPPDEVVPGEPTFTDPTCDTDPAVDLPDPAPPVEVPSRKAAGPVIETADVDGVHYVVSGDLIPGGTVEVDATALEGFEIAEGATTHWSHTFPAVTGCTVVDPPEDTPESTDTPVATPTVVEAGLTNAGTPDLRGQQGLVLLVAGMIMMMVAGGLGFARPRAIKQD